MSRPSTYHSSSAFVTEYTTTTRLPLQHTETPLVIWNTVTLTCITQYRTWQQEREMTCRKKQLAWENRQAVYRNLINKTPLQHYDHFGRDKKRGKCRQISDNCPSIQQRQIACEWQAYTATQCCRCNGRRPSQNWRRNITPDKCAKADNSKPTEVSVAPCTLRTICRSAQFAKCAAQLGLGYDYGQGRGSG